MHCVDKLGVRQKVHLPVCEIVRSSTWRFDQKSSAKYPPPRQNVFRQNIFRKVLSLAEGEVMHRRSKAYLTAEVYPLGYRRICKLYTQLTYIMH
jgi:hypothetical protein